MATLAELLTPVTVDEAKALILALLEAVGFPATAWQRFSVPRTFVAMISELYSDSRTGFTNIVMSRLLDLATGDALTALAKHFFNIDRALATPTVGTFLLTDTGGAPYDIEIGQVLVRDLATNKLYRNTSAGTLGINGTRELQFTAEGTGSSYNIGSNATLDFAETLEGVEVTNPSIGSTGTWITTSGTDDQTDSSLREACKARWATLGAGTADAYKAWAIEGAPTLTKVRVYVDSPGSVRVILATDSGGASTEEEDAADENVQLKRPVGLRAVNVYAATSNVTTINATVNVRKQYVDGYEARLEAARIVYQRDIHIGQTITQSLVDSLLHEPGGVESAAATTSPGSLPVVSDFDAIPVLEIGDITVVTVD